jgi:3-hydroxybutyrate dehydrogenase
MTKRLDGKVAIVTGASRGIGKAIAGRFAQEGAKIVLNARTEAPLQAAADELRTEGATVFAHAADVTDRAAVESLIEATIETFGQIDILVNNAGVYIASPFMAYDFDDFSHVVNANLYSVFHMTQAVLKGMVERQSGRIINIASTAGKWGSRNQSAYNASKHAVIGLTRCLALEMASNNITVNAICPWFVETDMIDTALEDHAGFAGATPEQVKQVMLNTGVKKRLIQPDEVAHMAVYLASDESDMVNGQSFTIDGGYTMI